MLSRILLVDDHSRIRADIRSLFSGQPFEICGEAEDGLEAVDQVRKLLPDLVILDLTMPKMNGVLAAKEIRRIAPQTKIVIFTAHEVPKSSKTMQVLAVDAFVSKSNADRLLQEVKHLFVIRPLTMWVQRSYL